MSEQEASYEVALSFLVKDDNVARTLHEQLRPNLKTFYFPENQDELAGTEGMETMRAAFLGARLSVVLFSEGWGESPWTRVEAQAIKDSCLERGFDNLFFVNVDESTKLPKWIPNTHVRFNLKDYGLEGAVGAIKARVQELGGKLEKPDAAAFARIAKEKVAYSKERDEKFRSMPWIQESVWPSVKRILGEIEAKATIFKGLENMNIDHGPRTHPTYPGGYTVNYENVGLVVNWKQAYVNSLTEAELSAKVYSTNMEIGDQRFLYREQPIQLRDISFKPELGFDRSVKWVKGYNGPQMDEEAVVSQIFEKFFEAAQNEISKRNQR